MSNKLIGSIFAALTFLLVGCGGGGGGSSGASVANAGTTTLQGVAAVGAGIPNSVVSVKCVTGAETQGRTDGSGGFRVQLNSTQTLPCILRIAYGSPAQYLHGYAPTAGYANINPLTELVLSKALGTDPEVGYQNFSQATGDSIAFGLNSAIAYVIAQVNAITHLNITSNPMGGNFVVGTGDDTVLDSLANHLANSGKTFSDLRFGAASGARLNDVISFGTAVSLQLYSDIPQRVMPGSKVTFKVLALNAAGVSLDVTAQSHISVNLPNMVSVSYTSSLIELMFSQTNGAVGLRIEALGLSVDKTILISQSALLNLQRIELAIGEGYSGLVANVDNSYSLLPGRSLLIKAAAIYDSGSEDITQNVQISSTNSTAVSVQPGSSGGGGIPWWIGRTLTPGRSTIVAQWGGLQTSVVINVSKGLVLRASTVAFSGITENSAGRTTTYFLAGNQSYGNSVQYSESSNDNQWTGLVPLPAPPSVLATLNGIKVAESPNGYRAVLTISNKEKWLYLIGPTGEVKGPTIVSSSVNAYPLNVAITPDGKAHVWFYELGTVTRQAVRFSDLRLTTVNTLTINNSTANYISADTGTPQVSVSDDGTVGVAWTDTSCQLHYALDKLSNLGSYDSGLTGAIRVQECAGYFNNIYTMFDIAAGANEMAAILQYGTDFNATNIEVIRVNANAQASSKLVEKDSSIKAGSPKIAMTPSGEFVATWATESRGVWAARRPSGGETGAPFLVEPPFFSLATPSVTGVYSRGDGRFVFVWPGGLGLRLRNYSGSAGLGDRLSFPYQNTTATNNTSFVMSPYGISAAWSFYLSFSVGEYDAMQRFLP